MPAYTHGGPVNCNTDVELSTLEGKTAVVTGGKIDCGPQSIRARPFNKEIAGANGLGEAYVRALTRAG
jgi:hypothetical protein